MLNIGQKNRLRIIKQVDFGCYLEGDEEFCEILIPTRYVPKDKAVGDILEVFVYLDSEDRLIATTEEPFAEVGKCAFLQVVGLSEFGAFLDWGLVKDLLVPFKEQRVPMQVGKNYTVFLYLDVTGRIAASSKLSSFLEEENKGTFTAGMEVNLHIASRSDIGYKAVINNTHLGIIHNNELLLPIHIGENHVGYIKSIRPDGRINLSLQPKSKELMTPLTRRILQYIEDQGGSTSLTDKSPAEEIYQIFNVSKSNYKKALGALYKEKRVLIDKESVTLV